jgi:hypothetical protein
MFKENKPTSCIFTYSVFNNNQKIWLPHTIQNVDAIRVKHVSWYTSPLLSTDTMLWISSPELGVNSDQSGFMSSNPADPFSSNQLVSRRNIIGSFVVAPTASNVPNANNNDAQNWVWLKHTTDFTNVSFSLETDSGGMIAISNANRVSVTIEFLIKN